MNEADPSSSTVLAADNRKRAVAGLADTAESLGLCEDLVDELTRRRAKMLDADSPRQRSKGGTSWRGQESSTGSEDPIDTASDGELNLLDQMGSELWNRFHRKKNLGKQLGRRSGSSQEG
jgi:hypothetical protein